MRSIALLSVLLVTSAALRAQSPRYLAVPAQYDSTAAGHVAFWALSPFDARRQLVIDKKHLTGLKSQSIRSISVRRHVAQAMVAGQLKLDIWLSNTTANADAPSPQFASNRGKDHTLVFSRQLQTPTLSASNAKVAPWKGQEMVTLQLQKRFAYTGGNLCIETKTEVIVKNKNKPNPAWFVCDALARTSGTNVTRFGTSCIRQMPGQPAGADAGSLVLGNTAVFYLAGDQQSGLALAVFGSNDKKFGSVPLPADLGILGAPGCKLYIDWLFTVPVTITGLPKGPRGHAVLSFEIPANTALAGKTLFNQWAVVDIGNNLLGMRFSNGVKAPIASVSSSLGIAWIESTDSKSPTGRITLGRTPVLRFEY